MQQNQGYDEHHRTFIDRLRGALEVVGSLLQVFCDRTQKSQAPRGPYYNPKGRIFESKFPFPG
jgi:hypothetical protein